MAAVITNHDWQLDRIWKHLVDKPLDMSIGGGWFSIGLRWEDPP